MHPQLALSLGGTLEAKVKDMLDKAEEIIQKYKPAQFGITVGAPLTAQISFTWNVK